MNQHAYDVAARGIAALLHEAAGVPIDTPLPEGLARTPDRVIKALLEMTAGRHENPADILSTTFEGSGYDEVVALRGISFTSVCEHHLMPFTGEAHLAYLPGARVVGLSKLARLVECHARRLQIQERMTVDIADDLMNHLGAAGAVCVVSASHACMACRGVRKPGAIMVTSCVRGTFRTIPMARQEVFSMLGVGEV